MTRQCAVDLLQINKNLSFSGRSVADFYRIDEEINQNISMPRRSAADFSVGDDQIEKNISVTGQCAVDLFATNKILSISGRSAADFLRNDEEIYKNISMAGRSAANFSVGDEQIENSISVTAQYGVDFFSDDDVLKKNFSMSGRSAAGFLRNDEEVNKNRSMPGRSADDFSVGHCAVATALAPVLGPVITINPALVPAQTHAPSIVHVPTHSVLNDNQSNLSSSHPYKLKEEYIEKTCNWDCELNFCVDDISGKTVNLCDFMTEFALPPELKLTYHSNCTFQFPTKKYNGSDSGACKRLIFDIKEAALNCGYVLVIKTRNDKRLKGYSRW